MDRPAKCLSHYIVRRKWKGLGPRGAGGRWEWAITHLSDPIGTLEGTLHVSRSRAGAIRGVIRQARSRGIHRVTITIDHGQT